jgi:NDP-sugar pyrophosphorylase family protein
MSVTGAPADVQVLVLAAGLGTRLWPLTGDRAKPAVPFLGRPLVAHVVDLVARHGLGPVVVNTHYRAESVRAALADAPVPVRFSHEVEILGTAGAIRHALDQGLLADDRHLLVVNGKLFTDLDLGALVSAHRASGARVTMALRPNPAREHFRDVEVEGDVVRAFGALPPTRPDALLFTGAHVLAPEVLATIPRGNSDTIRDTYPPLLARGAIRAHVDGGGRWWELSTLERYLGLHHAATRLGLGPDVHRAPGATIDPDAHVEASVLWPGATVARGARLTRVVLGEDVHVGPGEVFADVAIVRADRVAASEGPGERRGAYVHVPIDAAIGASAS